MTKTTIQTGDIIETNMEIIIVTKRKAKGYVTKTEVDKKGREVIHFTTEEGFKKCFQVQNVTKIGEGSEIEKLLKIKIKREAK